MVKRHPYRTISIKYRTSQPSICLNWIILTFLPTKFFLSQVFFLNLKTDDKLNFVHKTLSGSNRMWLRIKTLTVSATLLSYPLGHSVLFQFLQNNLPLCYGEKCCNKFLLPNINILSDSSISPFTFSKKWRIYWFFLTFSIKNKI